MDARDSTGRRVSLLNDDSQQQALPHRPSYPSTHAAAPTGYPLVAVRSGASSPGATPQLLRSYSDDSQRSSESISPITPIYGPGYMYTPTTDAYYDDYASTDGYPYPTSERRHSALSNDPPSPYDEDPSAPSSSGKEALGSGSSKRYPCRYREIHNCNKTFTTSGHASRHSKIHTAEKAVPCTHPGCSKKFTRADNMKQHLETHSKERQRQSTRPSTHASSGPQSSRRRTAAEAAASAHPPPPIPPATDRWNGDASHLQQRSNALRPERSGLDALAMAVTYERTNGRGP